MPNAAIYQTAPPWKSNSRVSRVELFCFGQPLGAESATEKMQPFEHVMTDLRLRCIAAGLLRADEHLQLDCRAHGVERHQQVY